MLKSGQLLLAEPFLLDPNFKRSAVAIVDRHDEGTVGFVLSQPLELQVPQLLRDFPDFDAVVSSGGPVQRDTLHFLHTLGPLVDDAIHVDGELYWGGDFSRLTLLLAEGIADEHTVKFFLGYSGWSPGQLEEEMAEGTWVVGDLTEDLLFETDPEDVWSKAMGRLGNTHAVIGTMAAEALN